MKQKRRPHCKIIKSEKDSVFGSLCNTENRLESLNSTNQDYLCLGLLNFFASSLLHHKRINEYSTV